MNYHEALRRVDQPVCPPDDDRGVVMRAWTGDEPDSPWALPDGPLDLTPWLAAVCGFGAGALWAAGSAFAWALLACVVLIVLARRAWT